MNYQYRYYKNSPEIIQLAILMYIRSPLSLRHVEDLLFERGIDICHETVRLWWNRFGPAISAKIRKNAHLILNNIQVSGGISMRSSSKSEARRTIFGALQIMKMKFLTLL